MPQTFDCNIHWNTWQLRAHNLIQVNFRVFVIVQFPASSTGKTEWDEHLGAEAVKRLWIKFKDINQVLLFLKL